MAEAMSQPFSGSRRLETLCYLLVWTGAAALLLVPKGSPQLVLAFCLLIAPSCFLRVPAQRTIAYRTVWRLITVAFILGSLLDWRLSGRELEQTLVAQMCFFQTYKAYNDKNYSDYLQIVLFATLMVAFSGLVGDSVFFVVVLVPYVSILVAFLWTLNLSRYYLCSCPVRVRRRACTVGLGLGYQVTREQLVPRYLTIPKRSWSIQTLFVFAAGIAMFYALPRKHVYSPSHFASGSPGGRDPVVSGLSGSVGLRHFSQIKTDDRHSVKVTFPGKIPPADALYLRMGSLERLSNHEWIHVGPRPFINNVGSNDTIWLQQIDSADRPSSIPHIVEHLNAPAYLPIALPDLIAIDQLETRSPRGRIRLTGPLSLKSYRAFSWDPEAPARPPVRPVSREVWDESLALPDDLTTLSIWQTATGITYGLADNLSRAEAIEEYLRSKKFRYTLNVEPLNGPAGSSSPIERFLSTHRQGNCEVFASAMVVLCRNVNVPSRLAIGYHGGIRGENPNEFIFRNRDAHSWVEVWSPERGWVTFDPTPPPPLEVYSGRFSFKTMMDWFGSATAKWNRMVVWYDNEAKARWMSYLWTPIESWALGLQLDGNLLARLAPRIRENIMRPQVIALLLCLLVVNATAAVIYLRARRRWYGAGRGALLRHNDPWQKFYCAAVDVLRGKIAGRQPDQTPREFLESLACDRSLDPFLLQPVVRLYHHGRFGGISWDRDVAREAGLLLRRLAQSVEGRPAERYPTG